MNFFELIFPNMKFNNANGLTDELKGIYIYQYYIKNSNSILVVCNSILEANKMYQIINTYTDDVLLFPMDDFLTSEVLAVSPEFKISRLEVMGNLSNKKIVVTNMMGYLRFLPSKNLYLQSFINIKKGENISLNELKNKLFNIGYIKEVIVDKTGTMAIRGYVIDIFPIKYDNPIRIEFWGDEIESIKEFDINTQLKIKEIDVVNIMPNSEFIIEEDVLESNKQRDLINYYNPSAIKDYLNDCVVIYNDYDELKKSYDILENDIFEYCISSGISTDTKFMHNFLQFNIDKSIDLSNFHAFNNYDNYDSYEIDDAFSLDNLQEQLSKYLIKNDYIIIGVSNRYQANKLLDILQERAVFTNLNELFIKKINIVVFNFTKGFIFNKIVVISESEIFNKNKIQSVYKTNFKYSVRVKDINKLEIGDYIVHNIHGIGRYCGIKTILKNGLEKDYLQVEYKDNDKLYIPVEKIDMISKYSSKEGLIPKINKLGSTEWQKTKLKARNRAHDIADKLLKLYALREMQEGFAFDKDGDEQKAFEKEFAYTETIDQIKVIDEIKKDMESPHPMDRLLCGDVGYGKTEVAFRAAFKAILSGKQVALLCPTTILSSQHYQNALERFKTFPVEIRLLNRFVSQKEIKNIKSGLKNGTIDFVIGTHKLLGEDIAYENLGLLIIDEEQRFGVTHKEKIKQIKNNVDVLTLSATPIPRTLQMSLSGLRQLSTIETPPNNRYPVQTYVLSYNKKVIKDAIYKELSRHGQVFLLYNRIDDMNSKMREIQELVSDASIACAHGRMSKDEIEDIMFKFTNKEYDILLCTTIIETGIDIPNVNTLIIIDADKFGLSQLYQLRGRVGRTNKIAYCYLMYDETKILNEIAKKRLNAIKEFTELGSGLAIAMRDLAIRGAGDILGSEQAGFVDSVGIELFMDILKQEIDKLKGLYVPKEEDTQPLINVSTSISNSYVLDEDLKIEIHKKINQIDSYDKLESIKKEIEDRFGKLDEKIIIYMYEELFEKLALRLNITKIKQTNEFVELTINKDLLEKMNGEKLFIKVLQISPRFKFKMFLGNLLISLPIKTLEKHFVFYLLDLLNVINDSTK